MLNIRDFESWRFSRVKYIQFHAFYFYFVLFFSTNPDSDFLFLYFNHVNIILVEETHEKINIKFESQKETLNLVE